MKTKLQSISAAALAAVMAAAVVMSTGCAGDRYTQSTGESIDDAATSGRVKKALSDDPEYKYPQVEVKTFKGTAQLSGFVNTRAQKSHAGDIAKNVQGVQEVVNNITIKD
jgi:hyperosmotically inducible periplasmic protein